MQFGADVYLPPVKLTVQTPGPLPPLTLEISPPGLLNVFVMVYALVGGVKFDVQRAVLLTRNSSNAKALMLTADCGARPIVKLPAAFE